MTRTAAALVPLALLGAALLVPGCVHRTMVLRSNPEGARALIDGDEIEGRTPLEVPFDWGGTRRVTLMAPGHRILEADVVVEDPWFARFPFDLFTDLLWPGTIEDRQVFDLELERYSGAPTAAEIDARTEGLLARAAAYRGSGAIVATPAAPGEPGRSGPPVLDENVPLPPPPGAGTTVPPEGRRRPRATQPPLPPPTSRPGSSTPRFGNDLPPPPPPPMRDGERR